MKILVLNCGSSSVKYELHDPVAHVALAEGEVERIGEEGGVPDHGRALELVLAALLDPASGAISSLAEVAAVGHRVVHGGSHFTAPARLTPEVVAKIEECAPLAPLHNPPILLGIKEALRLLPDTPQVAVFDTAFHAGIPPRAHVYALPFEYYRDHGVRRYGFHGISYQYVSRRAGELLGGDPARLKMVIAHLGNGASMAALKGGRAVDTSMGMTPLEGLVMGGRGGDVDPGVLLYLLREEGLSTGALDRILNKESGLLGLSGVSNDMRDVLSGAAAGDERCRLALDVYCYRAKKYIGAYAAALGGLDALVFTGGVGEHSPDVRAAICEGLGFLGLELDAGLNQAARGTEAPIGRPGSRVQVLVVPTDEERLIAEETMAVVIG